MCIEAVSKIQSVIEEEEETPAVCAAEEPT